MTTADRKGEIGFISGANLTTQQSKPLKVKATIANIPVVTESMQKSAFTSGKTFASEFKPFIHLNLHFKMDYLQDHLKKKCVNILLISKKNNYLYLYGDKFEM